MVVEVDTASPPGAWRDEMARAPWAFGQSRYLTIKDVLYKMRREGMWAEAQFIEREFYRLSLPKHGGA